MKKNNFLLTCILLVFFLPLFSETTQKEPKLFRVVYVKGNPVFAGKNPIRDGQKLTDTQQIIFTGISDVVTLINESLDKVQLRPQTKFDLQKPLQVKYFVDKALAKSLLEMNNRSRGLENKAEFQSFKDTLRLHLKEDLNLKESPTGISFRLFNLYMEALPKKYRLSGDYLEIFPGKPGIYFLERTRVNGTPEPLAEIEIIDINEIRAELKYVGQIANSQDSVMAFKTRYLRKIYPKIPLSQANWILEENK